jgi:Co/Zn/Cd efflux system component
MQAAFQAGIKFQAGFNAQRRQSLHLSLDGVPASIEVEAVKNYLSALPGVNAVHDRNNDACRVAI